MTTIDANFEIDANFDPDTACYLRVNNGLDVIRIAHDGVSLAGNDLHHSEWCLTPSSLSPDVLASIHHFCAAQGIEAPDWTVMAQRHL